LNDCDFAGVVVIDGDEDAAKPFRLETNFGFLTDEGALTV
jgi:hypothetical protein